MNHNRPVSTEIEQILNNNGLIPTLCHCLSAIACSDGPLTMDEYALLVTTTRKIAELSDNPALVNIHSLQGILLETPLEESLKQLSYISHLISHENRQLIFNLFIPLISTQINSEFLLPKFTRALKFSENNKRPEFLQHIPQRINQLKDHLSHIIAHKDTVSHLKSFAWRFNQKELYDYLCDSSDDDIKQNIQPLNQHLQLAKKQVIDSANTFRQQVELHCHENSSAEKLSKLAEILVEQVEQRLEAINKRAELQKKFFKQDINDFIEKSVNEVELNLHQHLNNENWTDPEVWKNFAQTDLATSITEHYNKLQTRYDEIFSLWEKEFSSFSKELLITRKIILQGLEKQELSQLIQPPAQRLNVLKKLDNASGLIINTLKTAGAGSAAIGGIAFATGVPASMFLIGVTTIGSFIISSPLGWAAIGTITLAGIYQYLSKPEKRKAKEIKSKRALIEEGLKNLIGNPVQSHEQHLSEITDKFRETADKNFAPLLQDASLAIKMNELQLQVIHKINQSTINEVNLLHL